MGVRGLYSFIKSKGVAISLKEIQQLQKPLRIGIDISYYMYKWQASSAKVLELIENLRPHKTILIFDGKAPQEKQQESNRRKQVREEDIVYAKVLRDSISSIELTEQQKSHLERTAEQLEKRGWQNTRELRHAFKNDLYKNFIPLLKSKGEADFLLVSLAAYKDIDIVISGDMDLLVLGVKYQWSPNIDGKTFRIFDRDVILNELGINDAQFRSFCAMCSSDYTKEEQRLDINHAYHGIRIYKTIDSLKDKHKDWLEEWPPEDHPYFQAPLNPTSWILDEQMAWYSAWKKDERMPYREVP